MNAFIRLRTFIDTLLLAYTDTHTHCHLIVYTYYIYTVYILYFKRYILSLRQELMFRHSIFPTFTFAKVFPPFCNIRTFRIIPLITMTGIDSILYTVYHHNEKYQPKKIHRLYNLYTPITFHKYPRLY